MKYSYKLEFKEAPDYEKLKFMFKKILLERDYIPDNKFDWSLGPGETFQRVDQDKNHSSISSCELKSEEAILKENIIDSDK